MNIGENLCLSIGNGYKIRSIYEKGLVAKYNFENIKGESDELKNAISVAKSYASSDSTILILGETGTGKELFAQSIHNSSSRKDGPFVAINCASLSLNLMESELFGYVEGAFTGAAKGGKMGLFELANNGTVFLDEIGEMPIEIQAKLLRVLQEKEIRKVGSTYRMLIDIRVIAATNRDLIADIKAKTFREDLYYRLSVLNLSIPPLRERKGDIFLLSKFFLIKNLGENYFNYLDKFYEIINKVDNYKWYGNVRELQNFIERISVLLKYHGNLHNFDQLIEDFLAKTEKHEEHVMNVFDIKNEISEISSAKEINNLKEREADNILNVLKQNNLCIQKSADKLGISRTTLWRKMKKYNLVNNVNQPLDVY